jgi:hypothetical protein
MAAPSDRESPPPAPAPGPRETQGEQHEQAESYGPLTLTRHVKPDGRALILYTDRRDDTPPRHGEMTADRPV